MYVERTQDDPRMRRGGWGDAESQLLYHVKQYLNRNGFQLIKKRMWRDGHMVDERQQYLREALPKKKGDRCLAIYNDLWAIEDAGEAFNRDGKVWLKRVNLGE